MQTVEKVTLVYENCESATFTYPHVLYLRLYNIQEQFFNYGNCITKEKTINAFEIAFHKDSVPDNELAFDKIGWIERIKYNDITHVIISYEDKSEDSYAIPWDFDETGNLMHNPHQTFEITENGHVIVKYLENVKSNGISLSDIDLKAALI